MAKVIMLFGEMGAGKNYHGEQWSKDTGTPFVDGDTFVTPEMIERVKRFKPLTKEMVTRYVDNLAGEIVDILDARQCPELVVGQALYRNEDRLFLEHYLQCMGHVVEWYWVRPSFTQNFKQLLTRPQGWSWVRYWLMNKPFFQKPTHKYRTIRHDTLID